MLQYLQMLPVFSHLKAVSFICFIHSITTGKKNSNEKITGYVIGYFNK